MCVCECLIGASGGHWPTSHAVNITLPAMHPGLRKIRDSQNPTGHIGGNSRLTFLPDILATV